jgi:HSP20 family protein
MALTRVPRRNSGLALNDSFINELPDRLRRMFEDALPFDAVQPVGWIPAMEIVEKPHALIATAELPGLAAENIDVKVEDNVLTVSGEKTEEKEEGEEDSQYHLWERRYGSFHRSFTLPSAVNTDRISAEFTKGVLTVTMPKSESVKAKGKKIPVSARQ